MDVKYTQEYYQQHLSGALSSAKVILNVLSSFYKPSLVIDFGCGSGAWLNIAKEMFHSKVLGIDQHSFFDTDMLILPDEYLAHNLETPLHLGYKFDLAISVEVAEHIAEEFADTFINSLCNHSDVVLFSAALPMQGGTGHINEKPCSYWAKKFAQHGFFALDCLRPLIWDNTDVEVWYKNNSLLFVSQHQKNKLERQIPQINYPLDVIHPQMLERILNRRKTNG